MANTAQEVLIAELLGDVGKLHDDIKALPGNLEKEISPALGAILKATEKAHGVIVQLGAAEKASFGNFAAAEKVALRDSLKAALREEAGEALASVARELATSARIHQDAAKGETRQRWQWIAVAFAGSLLAGALGFYGAHLLHDKQMANEAAFGRAVGTVWDSLDAKTKERIQAARNSQ